MTTESFNSLETALLDWIAEHSGDELLTAQVRAAELKRRDYTRTGFFVYLSVPANLTPVDSDTRPVCPMILSDALYDGAGCNLFLHDGRLHYLEIYARGGFLPEQLERFQLVEDV
jgi:hypothetical protein